MRYTIHAGTFFGIPVRIHFTFPLILIVFGLEGWLRGGWPEAGRAVLLTLAVFVCVVLHEFGHSLQVRRYGITVRDVVLLPIGGMARAERIPEKPRQEIVMAISGPLVNFVLAALILTVMVVLHIPLSPEPDFLTSLLAINIVLGTFNLIPAYPMDGGRILRGLLATRLPYLRATRYAAIVGQLIALIFVVVGFLFHELIMLPVIAVFIFVGAVGEESMIRVRYMLGGKRIREFVDTAASSASGEPEIPWSGIPAVDADTPAMQVYYHLKSQKLPAVVVVDGGTVIGAVSFERLNRLDSLPDVPR